MIHEASHNLIFKSGWANRVISIVANLPIVFASAVSFQKYHLLHHRYQGEMTYDADLPWGWEARAIGNSVLRKIGWLFGFFIVEGILRPGRIKHVKPVCRWVVLNNVVEYGFLAGLTVVFGWHALLYLFLSTFFSIGLHPCGARWIQEHFTYKAGQETYSYYGPINYVNFNIGHHNEHHDLPMIAWPGLSKLRRMAPEFYDTLYYHTSYTGLMLSFIFRRDISLFNRVVAAGPFLQGNIRRESVDANDPANLVPTAGNLTQFLLRRNATAQPLCRHNYLKLWVIASGIRLALCLVP